ncbi:MAG: hypothetical protein NT086_15655 [Proteobacteria bacterium]|nr:hypothetical protein [Pseudomonadota bacterium]
MTIKTIGCVFVLLSSFAQAEKIDAGQRIVSEAIAQWTKCINTELTEKIQFIASPSYIAEQILEQCDERYLKLKQLMLSDMMERNHHQDDKKIEQIVTDSLSDTKDNHRAKIISLVITHRRN